jgi:PKD repeat protein
LTFSAERVSGEEPALTFHWDFGDASSQDGMKVHYAYTQSGEYTVRVTATGLDASTNAKTLAVKVSGNIATRFAPAEKKRPE